MASRDSGALKAFVDALMELLRAAFRSSASERKSGSTTTKRTTTKRTTTKRTTSKQTATKTAGAKKAAAKKAVAEPGAATKAYVGDATGAVTLEYAPFDDDKPDPGEIVWAWVPFEEDHTQGKDRPVLVIGRQRKHLLALMLTSKDHDRDRAEESRWGRSWVDIGTGEWDRQRRPSEVRVDRVIRLDPEAVRREGATLDRKRFEVVAAGVRAARP